MIGLSLAYLSPHAPSFSRCIHQVVLHKSALLCVEGIVDKSFFVVFQTASRDSTRGIFAKEKPQQWVKTQGQTPTIIFNDLFSEFKF